MQEYRQAAETIVSYIQDIDTYTKRVNNAWIPHTRIILDRAGFVKVGDQDPSLPSQVLTQTLEMLHEHYRRLLDIVNLPLHVLVFNAALKMHADFRHVLNPQGQIIEQSSTVFTASHTMPLFMYAQWPLHYTYNVYIFYAGRVANRGGDGHYGRG